VCRLPHPVADSRSLQDEIRIVQASLLGSILANLLLILGMCFLFGGLRFREQVGILLVGMRGLRS